MSEAGNAVRSIPPGTPDLDAPYMDGLRSIRAVLEMLPIGVTIVEVEADGVPRILASNSAHDRIVGGKARPLLPIEEQSFRIFLADRASPTPVTELPGPRAARTGETVRGAEVRVLRPDGDWRFLSVSAAPIPRTDRSAPARAISVMLDVTEQRRVEQQLASSENFLRTVLQTSLDGFWIVDREGRLLDVNPAYCTMSGYGRVELLGMRIPQLEAEETPEETAANIQRIREAGGGRFERRQRRKDGSILHVDISVTLVGGTEGAMVCFLRDVTERKEAEEALKKSQAKLAVASRLAAMGTLVSGVAHEINNPLAGTLSAQATALGQLRSTEDLLQERAPFDREAMTRVLRGTVEALEDAQVGAERVSRIVKDMTSFGRPDLRRPRMRLVDAVRGALGRLPASVTGAARLVVEDLGAPDVLASARQVEEVVVNLVTNAAKAMPAGRVGQVFVSCSPGSEGMARLEVSDDGTGMAPETLERVFDPFFTTRPVGEGRGTGLGLAICQAIVTAHGGTLVATSQAGKGSVFRMELPAAPAAA